MSEMRTCNLSGAVSRATRNRHKVMMSACMQWSIALTVRSQSDSRAGQLSRRLRVLLTAHCCCTRTVRSEEVHWLRLHCTRFKRAPISDNGEGTVAHTRESRLNASSEGNVHRGSRVLAARVSASDWDPSGGLPPAPAPPLAAHFLRWMTIMEDVQLARKPNNMNHCIRVQPRPSPARETPVRASHHPYSRRATICNVSKSTEQLAARRILTSEIL